MRAVLRALIDHTRYMSPVDYILSLTYVSPKRKVA
jgi:hypothetical protein